MPPWISPGPLLGITVVVAVLLVSTLILISKHFYGDTNKKVIEDKVLLKKLLEGFGLDIPPELQEPEPTVIKSIKT